MNEAEMVIDGTGAAVVEFLQESNDDLLKLNPL